MANYPQYNYQPQPMGYQPQMQPMYQQYQPTMQMPQGQTDQLYCRPVASEEEARGVPVDFSGKPMVFPHLSAGRVYVKAFDQGSGSAVFRRFRMEEEQRTEAPEPVAYAPMSEVETLKDIVRKLEQKLESITKGANTNGL